MEDMIIALSEVTGYMRKKRRIWDRQAGKGQQELTGFREYGTKQKFGDEEGSCYGLRGIFVGQSPRGKESMWSSHQQ